MNVSRLLRQTVYVARKTGTSTSGEPTYGAATATPCRVEEGWDRLNRGSSGVEKVATTVLVTSERIGVHDRVWLSLSETSSADAARMPTSIQAMTDLRGTVIGWRTTL